MDTATTVRQLRMDHSWAGVRLTSANLTEEPDEPKGSRPVLKAGRLGDEPAQPSRTARNDRWALQPFETGLSRPPSRWCWNRSTKASSIPSRGAFDHYDLLTTP